VEYRSTGGLKPLSVPANCRRTTANVVDAFDLTDRGRIRVGLRADLLLVRGDPTRDITATRDILKVSREGHEFDRLRYSVE